MMLKTRSKIQWKTEERYFDGELYAALKSTSVNELSIEGVNAFGLRSLIRREQVRKMMDYCTNITIMSVRKVVIMDLHLFTRMIYIKHLELVDVGILKACVLHRIISGCKDLVHLNLKDNTNFNYYLHNNKPRLPISLEYLNLSGTSCNKEVVMGRCLAQCPNLKKLLVSDLHSRDPYSWFPTSRTVIEINGFKQLEELDMSWYVNKEACYNRHLIDFDKLPMLKVLKINGSNIDGGLFNLESSSVKHLEISDCYAKKDLHNFLERLKSLDLLYLDCSGYYFDWDWKLLCSIGVITNFDKLNFLDLSRWKRKNARDNQLIFDFLKTKLPLTVIVS